MKRATDVIRAGHWPADERADTVTLLFDDRYRRRLAAKIDDPLLQATWAAYEAMSPGERSNQLGAPLSEREAADVPFGFRLAKEISRLEIGQTVVVKDGTVLAVEGFEGTDKALARGGELAGKSGGAVAVKVAKEKHDLRFDLPCIGPRTLEVCATSGVRVLAFETGRTLLLEPDVLATLVKQHGLTLLTTA